MAKAKSTKKKRHFQAVVYVKLKDGVLDPQGSTIKRALAEMGYKGIEEVRSGKVFEITLNSKNKEETEQLLDQICKKLLANPVIEKYNFEVR
jgi:phosphoribosylformylglycinamidine synthase PurS subunit